MIDNRRNFIKKTIVAVSALTVPTYLTALAKEKHKLSFSTLGCPKWSFKEILKFAAEHDYQGIEIRGIQGEMDLTKCTDFRNENIKDSIRLVNDYGLQIVGLGSSAKVHFKEKAVRQKNLDEAKQFIDLAEKLNATSVRIFPDRFPADINKQETMDLMSAGLAELGDYAKGSKVKVLLETHGDLVYADDILAVLNNVGKQNVAIIWDIFNMWVKTKENPAEVYSKLKHLIQHVHLKDAVVNDGKINYTLFGKGESPILEAVKLLENSSYKGFYSFEWEKAWHPEIEEPEVAFPDFVKKMRSI